MPSAWSFGKAAGSLFAGVAGAFLSIACANAQDTNAQQINGQQINGQQINALALENGTVLKSYSSEYGDRSSDNWIALALIDGNPDTGWSSAQNRSAPNEFVFELSSVFSLSALMLDNSKSEEARYPGISARAATVSISTEAAAGPYREIFDGEVLVGRETEVALQTPVEARWVKLVITANGGYDRYTELMEFSAFGTPLSARREDRTYTGVYDTNWGAFYIEYDRGELSGCYDWSDGYFSGKAVGGLMNIEWLEDGGTDQGSAALAITEDGSQFSGLWYRNAALEGTWIGSLAADQSGLPQCAATLRQDEKSQISYSLDTYGSAKLYGIYFSFDSDVIEPESARTLADIQDWLGRNPGKSVVFEGHTDSKGSDDYNLTLSGKRAAAVSNWLVSNGLDAGRLQSKGFGETQPVASNLTESGRSLNRRVEMRVVN